MRIYKEVPAPSGQNRNQNQKVNADVASPEVTTTYSVYSLGSTSAFAPCKISSLAVGENLAKMYACHQHFRLEKNPASNGSLYIFAAHTHRNSHARPTLAYYRLSFSPDDRYLICKWNARYATTATLISVIANRTQVTCRDRL